MCVRNYIWYYYYYILGAARREYHDCRGGNLAMQCDLNCLLCSTWQTPQINLQWISCIVAREAQKKDAVLLNFSEKFHRVLEDGRLSLENTEAGCTLSFFLIQFYLFLAVLGLLCCMLGFSTCRKRGLLSSFSMPWLLLLRISGL